MSIDETTQTAFIQATENLLKIPRPEFRRKIFADVFNRLIELGEIKLEEKE